LVNIGEQLPAYCCRAHRSDQHSGKENQANAAEHEATPKIGGAPFTLSTGRPLH